jgi:Ca-activated chloride channel family protein
MSNPAAAVVLSLALWATSAYSQDAENIFRSETRLVLLHVSVLDKQNRPITSIPESAFRIYEEGEAQTVRVFAREDVPVSMGILLDNSQSMRGKEAQVREATLTLIGALQAGDEVFIMNFNDRVRLDQPLTSDRPKLEEALLKMKAGGGTAMRDAVSAAIDYLRTNGAKPKKVIVVVTDGYDRTSREPEEGLLAKARESDVQIYAVGLPNEGSRREANEGRRALDALTGVAGGRAYYLGSLENIREAMPRLANELGSQYTLGYSPRNTAPDGTFRKTKVTVNGFNNPVIRTRAGYYARLSPEPRGSSATR